MGRRLLIKGRAEDEMWNGGRGRLKRSMRRQEGRTRTEELRNKTSDGTQKEKKGKKKQRGTEQQHDSAPAGQHSSFLSPPLLELSSSSLSSFALPSWSLSVSLGPGLVLPPHIITAALARSLSMLLLIHTSSRLVTPAVLLSWSDLVFYLTPGRSSVHSPSGDGRRRGEEVEGRGQEKGAYG